MIEEPVATELTLDPDDWESFRALAHRMVDDALDEIRTIRSKPAYVPPPAAIKARILEEPVPTEPQGEEAVYNQFLTDVFPYRNGNIGPRFFGWVMGNGFPMGFMSDMLAATMDPHMAGLNQSPRFVEEKVIDWFRELMGFPTTSSGLLLSGGSMANLTGLAVGRYVKAGFDVKDRGLWDRPMMTVYGTEETHSWAKKTVELFGMGDQSLRRVNSHSDFTMDVDSLREAIRKDKRAGHQPIAVLATAGTVNTGATDDMNAIADLCQEEGLWMHVDGAFGALAAISPKLKHLVRGMERADSVAFDLHKWMYLPFEIACLLVRDGEAHHATFSNSATYLQIFDRGVVAGGIPFADRGIELTRGFKALKAWMSIKAYGLPRFANLIEQNVGQAQYLASLVEAAPELELTAPVPLNILCFRFVASGLSLEEQNTVNQEILYRLQERGIAVPSSTVLDGRFCIRAALVNHRTKREDLHILVDGVIALGQEILNERR
ncbi:MAG: aromatic-L-amino-acid/L-tryptophan decarboxylase [Fimbriimonadaceae bacterium]|jgi:glutamate/tyrosine decarboxylase-like PLP-dependent enzyme|nr:aromatic-L-amino-acid/L-tryptophan decarboxylase [Fimbriimonadaceae bacterium]